MKKFLSVLIAISMLLCIFASCDTNPDDKTTEAPTPTPTEAPTAAPTSKPTEEPTIAPTAQPTAAATAEPTVEPTEEPTLAPTEEPTAAPTEEPTDAPTEEPTAAPTEEPTVAPTEEPTVAPTEEPTAAPTEEPTVAPTEEPTVAPTEKPTVAPTEEPTVAPTEEPTTVPTDAPTVAPTEKVTEAITEEPTLAPTEEPTLEPTEKPTNAPTEAPTEEPTEADTSIHFENNFMISGEYASDLKSALKSNKINTGVTSSDTVIYVGEANAEIVNIAKANLARANNYYDFTIVTDGKDLAIYATSSLAIESAITYLIENLTKGGHITVPNDFSYTHIASDLPEVTINGNTLENVTVVAKYDLQDIASGLAKDLTLYTGYNVAYGTGAEGFAIELVATGSTNSIGNSYTLSYTNSKLYITAENKVTLAYAISSFIKALKNGLEITEGYSETFTFEIKTAVATDIELFKYCGTWQATDEANPTTMVSYWDAAYVEVDFTGNAITLMFSSPTTFIYRIDDGQYVTVNNITGDYTVYANDGGTHTVRVLWNEKAQNMYFAGVKVGEDTTLSRTPDRKYYIQFVGDSISDATSSFSHNSADLLDWDYSVIACEALSMVKDQGYWKYNNGFKDGVLTEGSMAWHFKNNFGVDCVGMEDAYFKLGIPNKWSADDPRFEDVATNYYTEKYDFNFATGNTPDIVFIFLGTNDISAGSSAAAIQAFKNTYIAFVEKLLEMYGDDTKIVVMQSLSTSNTANMYDTSHPRFVAIREIAEILTERYADNVYFLDENTHFAWGVEISSDGTHPTADGYATLTQKIAQWLEKKIK